MSLDPLEGARGSDTTSAVAHEGVSGAGGVASEDMAVRQLPYKTLTVGEDRTGEVEVV